MSVSVRNRSKRMMAFAALLVVGSQASTADTRPDDYVGRAKQLIRMLYPGLQFNLRPVIIDQTRWGEGDFMNTFSIEFHDLEPKDSASPGACWCSHPMLHATFVFNWQTEEKELVTMTAGGPAADGRMHEFAKEVNKHPEWSEAQLVAALKGAGAKFAPDHKAEFLRALPIEQLKPFVGGDLEVVSADFYVVEPGAGGKAPEASLTWTVQTKWHGPGSREAKCILQFEPFDGRLISIFRVP
jgi:hypothetical protein